MPPKSFNSAIRTTIVRRLNDGTFCNDTIGEAETNSFTGMFSRDEAKEFIENRGSTRPGKYLVIQTTESGTCLVHELEIKKQPPIVVV